MLTETAQFAVDPHDRSVAAAREIPRTAEKSTGGRILVVDDDALIRWGVAETLEPLGYEVFQAGDGAEAVRLLRDHSPFQAVLLDVQLPDCSDLRLLGLMRGLSPATPIVLMGAFLTPEIETEAASLGAARVLRKPFGLEALAPLVDILGRDERSDDPRR
jgi:DNA-binding NtrC family response regulator